MVGIEFSVRVEIVMMVLGLADDWGRGMLVGLGGWELLVVV